MSSNLRYDLVVKRSIPALAVLFALLLAPALLVPRSQAQVNGVPASVTSLGFGGHTTPNGPRPSVTSLGPNGVCCSQPAFPFSFVPNQPRPHHRRHNHQGEVIVPYAVPYETDNSSADADDEEDQYQGGPTIFDRRGPGKRTYAGYLSNDPASAMDAKSDNQTSVTPPSDPPEPAPTPTVIVFKDGHQLEVANYAIVGSTLFDLTPGHTRKVALADLDLPATQKENDDRGVDFQLPPHSQAN